jgi:hypothetical protein
MMMIAAIYARKSTDPQAPNVAGRRESNFMARAISAGVALALLAFAVPSPAQAPDGKFMVLGLGKESCGSYLQARQSPSEEWYVSWLGGFLTGMEANWIHRGREAALESFDMAGGVAWIDKYCREKPLNSVLDAGLALFVYLAKRAMERAR